MLCFISLFGLCKNFLQRPFLDHAEHLTEDVVSVFPAADSLEQYIFAVIANACGEDVLDDYCRGKITSYQVILLTFLSLNY